MKYRMGKAASYGEWLDLAATYDKANGLDHWRRRDETRQYDYVAIRARVDKLRKLKSRHDVRGLLLHLNEGIHGNLGGMGRAGLYGHAMMGTKHLIEDYVDEICHALDLIATDEHSDISVEEKYDFFQRASHCFGQSALMMSASGSLFFYHLGVARALLKEGLLPSIISGSSGGSIAGSIVCTHSDDELMEMLTPDYFIELFDISADKGKVDRGEQLRESLHKLVPDLTFQQAFEKTGRQMNISIAPAEKHQSSRLMNATTSPAVLMHSAIRASCAVPGFFSPVTLETLDAEGARQKYLPNRAWVDGAVSDDLPAKRLARLYGVNHFIVSHTNPGTRSLVNDQQRKLKPMHVVSKASRRTAREWFNAYSSLMDISGMHRGRLGTVNRVVKSLVNQEHGGDINIIADYKMINPLTVLDSPSEKKVRDLMQRGERCTWPKLEMVRQQTRISQKLREILGQYRVSAPLAPNK